MTGSGTRLRPSKTSPKISTICSCRWPLSANRCGESKSCGLPLISDTRPPASATSSLPAAMSQGFSPNSQNPSRRPQATHARSMAADQRADADQQDEPGDGVPEAPPADELDRNLTGVQPAANVPEPGHHASFAEVLAGLVAGRGAEPRHGARAPRRAGSRADSRSEERRGGREAGC